MRLKLDENLPDEARAAAVALGHDVDTVVDEELGGATDPDVLAAALRDERFVITLDRGFGDVRVRSEAGRDGDDKSGQQFRQGCVWTALGDPGADSDQVGRRAGRRGGEV